MNLVPTLRVGTQVGTLRVEEQRPANTRVPPENGDGTQSVPTCVPTPSVETR